MTNDEVSCTQENFPASPGTKMQQIDNNLQEISIMFCFEFFAIMASGGAWAHLPSYAYL